MKLKPQKHSFMISKIRKEQLWIHQNGGGHGNDVHFWIREQHWGQRKGAHLYFFHLTEENEHIKEFEIIKNVVEMKYSNNNMSFLLFSRRVYFAIMALAEEMIEFARFIIIWFTKIFKKDIRWMKDRDFGTETNLSV